MIRAISNFKFNPSKIGKSVPQMIKEAPQGLTPNKVVRFGDDGISDYAGGGTLGTTSGELSAWTISFM